MPAPLEPTRAAAPAPAPPAARPQGASAAGPVDSVEKGREDAALEELRKLELQGIWWDCRAECKDLEILKASLREGEPLEDAVTAYRLLFEQEKRNSVDPTGLGRRDYDAIGALLRPGESRVRAAQSFCELWRFERDRRYVDTHNNALESLRAVDAILPEGYDRLETTRRFIRDPQGLPAEMAREKERIQASGDEVRRIAEALEAPKDGPEILEDASWIVVDNVPLDRY